MGRRQATSTSGKLPEALLVLLASWTLAGCASPPPPAPSATETNLRGFAMANCLFWYIQKRGWDVEDIRGVSGGYVEMGDSSADTYAEISEVVSSWQPDIRTKHDLDVDLVKCFHLDENDALEALIEASTGG